MTADVERCPTSSFGTQKRVALRLLHRYSVRATMRDDERGAPRLPAPKGSVGGEGKKGERFRQAVRRVRPLGEAEAFAHVFLKSCLFFARTSRGCVVCI